MSEAVLVIRTDVMASHADVAQLGACARGLDANGMAENLCRCDSYLTILDVLQLAGVESA